MTSAVVRIYIYNILLLHRRISESHPTSNVTASNFLGISGGAISDGSSGSITIKGGVSSNVSGLTANSVYYVAKDGTLTTTSSSNVLVGRAISSTSIDLDYST